MAQVGCAGYGYGHYQRRQLLVVGLHAVCQYRRSMAPVTGTEPKVPGFKADENGGIWR